MHGAAQVTIRSSYRSDIDGLRAVAVLSVLLFHAFPQYLHGGFVGVDVFFVISGYLISTIFFKDFDRGTFDLAGFYGRRIRRIFPALITVLLACLAIGWIVLLPSEYMQLAKHIAASSAFVENLLLWSETGYFDIRANLKPLLHIWSLGIEEQFYIVWPIILWAAWKSKLDLFRVTLSIAGASFALNLLALVNHPTAAFYFPVTRFWELLIGAVLAHLTLYRPAPVFRRFANLRSFAGVAMLVWSAAEMSVENFPGWQTLAPTIGTALVISAGPDAIVNRHLISMPPMRWIGLISYPLYLWHWPLLAFARIAQEGSLFPWSGIAIIAAATALSWGTFRFIELPIRSGTFPLPRVATLLSAACILLGSVSLAVVLENGFPARSYAQTYNDTPPPDEALSMKACADRYQHLYAGGFIQNRDICLFSEERTKATDTIIVGDSHALRLYEAFVELGVNGVTVIGRGSCAPIFNAPNVAWLKCQPTDDQIIDFAISSSAK